MSISNAYSKIKNLTAYTIFNRFFQYVKSIKRLNQIFRDNNFKIIIFNNIDMYVLFAVSTIFKKIDITKIIEISDLIYLHEKNNLISKIFKFLEKLFLKKLIKQFSHLLNFLRNIIKIFLMETISF